MTERSASHHLLDKAKSLGSGLVQIFQENQRFTKESQASWDFAKALVAEFTRHPQQPEKIFTQDSVFTIAELLTSAHEQKRYGLLRIQKESLEEAFYEWVLLVQSKEFMFSFMIHTVPGSPVLSAGAVDVIQARSEKKPAAELQEQHSTIESLQVLIGAKERAQEIQIMRAGMPDRGEKADNSYTVSLTPQNI